MKQDARSRGIASVRIEDPTFSIYQRISAFVPFDNFDVL
jgi:hypothetical protein